jgi:hypothetical protein
MKSSIPLLLLLFLLFPALAFAELPMQVESDYSVLDGTVVMPLNDEYIVDLDSSDGLHVGDILTVVAKGERITHPVSQELLGYVYLPKGFLQVTRVSSGYSYAKNLSSEVEPKTGAQVRRFEQVPALFVDKKDDDGAFSSQMKADLPQFKWLEAGDDAQPLLVFTLKNDSLVVKTSEEHLLHSYTVSDNQHLVAKAEPVRRSYVSEAPKPKRRPLEQASHSLLSLLNIADDDSFSPENLGVIRQSAQTKRGVWMSPNLSGNPVGVAVADLDGDGLQEIAVALLKILSMDVLDLDGDGRQELYLTAVVKYQLSSFVVEFNGSDYDIVIDRVRWYLRSIESFDQKRVLVGQEISNDEKSFEGKPFYVHREGKRLVRGEEIDLPGLINMYSFLPFTDKEGKQYYAYLSNGDYLRVVSTTGEALWASGEFYGGSESCFNNREGTDVDSVIPTCIRSRLIKTEDNEFLVAQNDGQRLMERWRKYKKSQLVSLSWNGFSMVENWRTATQQGYLGDFAFADADNDGRNEVVMAVKFQHKGYITQPRASVVLYDMD